MCADIFNFGSSRAVSVAPSIQGSFYPNIDNSQGVAALGYSVPWGGSALLTKPVAVEQVVEGASGTTTDGISEAVTSINDVVKSVFEGLSGIQGPVGPQGPPGTPATWLPISGPAGMDGADGADGAPGVDAFANIDIPIPYSGWEGGFTNNSPGAGSVAWVSFKLKFQGVEYTIAAGDTSDAYLYWDVASPTALSHSATQPALASGKFFAGYNNVGTFSPSNFIKYITSGAIFASAIKAVHIDALTITAGKIAADAIETDKINNLNVTTGKLANNAATSFDSDSTDGSTAIDTTIATIATVSNFVASGGFLLLYGECEAKSDVGADNCWLYLYRGSTLIGTSNTMTLNAATYVKGSVIGMDAPAAGTYTYYLKAITSLNAGLAKLRKLQVQESKK